MRVGCVRMWEFVACVHAVIFCGYTRFLVQALSTHYNTTQITIHLNIQASLTVIFISIEKPPTFSINVPSLLL